MWVEGKREDIVIKRSTGGQLPEAIPGCFCSRKCIYLFVSIKAWPRQEAAVQYLKVSYQGIVGDRHSKRQTSLNKRQTP